MIQEKRRREETDVEDGAGYEKGKQNYGSDEDGTVPKMNVIVELIE